MEWTRPPTGRADVVEWASREARHARPRAAGPTAHQDEVRCAAARAGQPGRAGLSGSVPLPAPCAARRGPPPAALERMTCGDQGILSGLRAPCCSPSAGNTLRSPPPLATMDHHPHAPLSL